MSDITKGSGLYRRVKLDTWTINNRSFTVVLKGAGLNRLKLEACNTFPYNRITVNAFV